MAPVAGLWGIIFALGGLKKTVAYLQAEAEANWIATYQPEIWQNTHKFLLLSGYLTYRLVGKYVDSIGCQVAYIPFDYTVAANESTHKLDPPVIVAGHREIVVKSTAIAPPKTLRRVRGTPKLLQPSSEASVAAKASPQIAPKP